MRTALCLAALLAALGAVRQAAAPPAAPVRSAEGSVLPRADFLRVALPGQSALLADYYWIQLLQQAGLARTADEYRDLFAWADLTTDLEPKFYSAYKLGALLIPFNRGRESWVNGEQSRAIIEKGLKHFPKDTPLRMYLAHNLIYFDHDYRGAAALLSQMAKEPNTPSFFGPLATRLYAQASEFDTGLEFARAMRDSAKTDQDRAFFEHRIKEIESERVLQQVDAAAMAYFRRHGRQAASLMELITAGDLPLMPVDPLGGVIYLDDFGRARTDAAPFRLEVFDADSKALAAPKN